MNQGVNRLAFHQGMGQGRFIEQTLAHHSLFQKTRRKVFYALWFIQQTRWQLFVLPAYSRRHILPPSASDHLPAHSRVCKGVQPNWFYFAQTRIYRPEPTRWNRGSEYLSSLLTFVPYSANANYYIQIVRGKWLRRKCVLDPQIAESFAMLSRYRSN